MYDAAHLTGCKTQHVLRPLPVAKTNRKRNSNRKNKGNDFVCLAYLRIDPFHYLYIPTCYQ